MNSTQNERDIFLVALEINAPSELAGYLHQACGNDAELRRRVDALLRRHQQSQGMLDAPPPGFDWSAPLDAVAKAPGKVIGPYKLLEQIGEGGMGVVFMAQQERPVRRKVALKIIKPGMDTRLVIARFEAERQALALMDHPNIAKVLDAGATDAGRPYFVMELVKGVPIIDYCDQQKLSIGQRLELLIAVCQAVQHAHQKGIIHRDLKPSNVLVAEYDGHAVPKVIDFGVAKAIGKQLTEQTMFTQFGQIVGTFEYMSPEQARFNQLDIDTRSDIYSLGVLLYELLAGSTPFEKQRREQATFDEILRIICEEEPLPPSTRLTSSDALSAIAARRRAEPARLNRLVRGELDWIVMKALEKDRSRRYQTAGALARELQRHLNDEPVEACPPSRAYRLQKFTRRNRVFLTAAALVAAALLAGVVASVSQAVRATQAETLAESLLLAERQSRDDAIAARAKAEANSQNARRAVDDMYTQIAEKWLANQAQMQPIQREFLEKALGFYTGFAQKTSDDPAVRLETARAFRRIAEIQHRLGEPAQAEAAFDESIARLQTLEKDFPSNGDYRAELAVTLHKLGVLLGDTGRYPEEEKVHRRGLELQEHLAADVPENAAYRRDLGRGRWFVAEVLTSLRRRREAKQSYQLALAIQRPLVAEFPGEREYREHLAESYLGLGKLDRHLGQAEQYAHSFDNAAELFEELSQEMPNVPAYRSQLANAYYWRARGLAPTKAAEEILRKALALQKKLADDFPAVADYRYDLFRSLRSRGALMRALNRPEEAETAFREAIANTQKLIGDSPSVHYYRGGLALTYLALGRFFTEQGRLHDAEDAFRQSIANFEKLVVDFPDVPNYTLDLRDSFCELAAVLKADGRPNEAADAYREALQVDPKNEVAQRGIAELESSTPNDLHEGETP